MAKKKIILLSVIIAMLMSVIMTTFVYAANEDVTLEKVKDNVCTIKLGEDGEVIKKLLSVDNEKKEILVKTTAQITEPINTAQNKYFILNKSANTPPTK